MAQRDNVTERILLVHLGSTDESTCDQDSHYDLRMSAAERENVHKSGNQIERLVGVLLGVQYKCEDSGEVTMDRVLHVTTGNRKNNHE